MCIRDSDHVVGQVTAALEKSGQAKNTLLIMTSDNGSHWPVGDVKKYQHAANGNTRGQKADIWDGGHRVPFLARWPEKIKAGTSSEETICLTDLMATAAAIVGKKVPEGSAEDSYNILPALLGDPAETPIREATVHHSKRGKFAIRKGNWVLIDAPSGDDNAEPDWLKAERGYAPHDHPGELFDLEHDLIERFNRYAEHPEIVEELKTLLERYKQEGRSVFS